MTTWRERNPDAYNAAWRKWYRANAARKVAWKKRRREQLRAWLLELRSTMCCVRCGESAPECLHFHHIDPTTKTITVADTIERGWSKQRILDEIAKCHVLCANCHLKQHWTDSI